MLILVTNISCFSQKSRLKRKYHKEGSSSVIRASLGAQLVKNPPAIQETQVPSLGQEDPPGEGNGNPLQYSRPENPMDRGVWWATVHGVSRVRHN